MCKILFGTEAFICFLQVTRTSSEGIPSSGSRNSSIASLTNMAGPPELPVRAGSSRSVVSSSARSSAMQGEKLMLNSQALILSVALASVLSIVFACRYTQEQLLQASPCIFVQSQVNRFALIVCQFCLSEMHRSKFENSAGAGSCVLLLGMLIASQSSMTCFIGICR